MFTNLKNFEFHSRIFMNAGGTIDGEDVDQDIPVAVPDVVKKACHFKGWCIRFIDAYMFARYFEWPK